MSLESVELLRLQKLVELSAQTLVAKNVLANVVGNMRGAPSQLQAIASEMVMLTQRFSDGLEGLVVELRADVAHHFTIPETGYQKRTKTR